MTVCIKIKISSQNHFVVRGLSFQTMNKLPITINGSVQKKSHIFPLGWSNMAAKHGFSLFASMVETKIQYVLIKIFVISPFVLTLTVQNKVTVSYNSYKEKPNIEILMPTLHSMVPTGVPTCYLWGCQYWDSEWFTV